MSEKNVSEWQEKETPAPYEKRKNGRPEGGNIVESVKIKVNKPIRIDKTYRFPKVKVKEFENDSGPYHCFMCGKEYKTQKGNFLSGGKSPLWQCNNGYLPFCKTCTDMMLKAFTAFYSGNEEHALKHLCRTFDWYYDPLASSMTIGQAASSNNSRISFYPSKACIRQVLLSGKTYLDTIRHDYNVEDVITSVKDLPDEADQAEKDPEDFVVTREMLKNWGSGLKPDEYEFLENEYNQWVTKNVCNTKAQEEIYRNIALGQLDVRVARATGGKISEALDSLMKLMNNANILPKQNADNIIADTQTFGTLLKKYEETDPIPEPEEEWKDVDGIRKYMNTWYRGGLAKALHITNENSALYDEAVKEMEKYTVTKQETMTGELLNDSSIFDEKTEPKADGGGNTDVNARNDSHDST